MDKTLEQTLKDEQKRLKVPRFRAWDTVKKAMSEVQAIVYTEEKVYPIYFKEIRRYISFSEAILMQSTGLFDVNGKEIFESDIVKTTIFFGRADESGGFYEYEKELIGIVKQLEGAWVIDTEKGAVYLWSDIDENEVLGNIWDNLELLEDLE